jgi:hypothetical protein
LTVPHRFGQHSGELITPGLVQLAVQLASAAVDSPLHLVLGNGSGAASVRGLASPAMRGVLFGLQLLQGVFELQPEARAEILRTCQVSGARHCSWRRCCTLPCSTVLLRRSAPPHHLWPAAQPGGSQLLEPCRPCATRAP